MIARRQQDRAASELLQAASQTGAGMKIGQLCLLRLTSPAEHPYGSAQAGSKYQGQRGPTPSRSYQNFIKSS